MWLWRWSKQMWLNQTSNLSCIKSRRAGMICMRKCTLVKPVRSFVYEATMGWKHTNVCERASLMHGLHSAHKSAMTCLCAAAIEPNFLWSTAFMAVMHFGVMQFSGMQIASSKMQRDIMQRDMIQCVQPLLSLCFWTARSFCFHCTFARIFLWRSAISRAINVRRVLALRSTMWCNWTTFVGWLCQFWLLPFFNSILFACLDSRRKKSSNSMFVVWEAWRHISEMQRIYCRISTICHIDRLYVIIIYMYMYYNRKSKIKSKIMKSELFKT